MKKILFKKLCCLSLVLVSVFLYSCSKDSFDSELSDIGKKKHKITITYQFADGTPLTRGAINGGWVDGNDQAAWVDGSNVQLTWRATTGISPVVTWEDSYANTKRIEKDKAAYLLKDITGDHNIKLVVTKIQPAFQYLFKVNDSSLGNVPNSMPVDSMTYCLSDPRDAGVINVPITLNSGVRVERIGVILPKKINPNRTENIYSDFYNSDNDAESPLLEKVNSFKILGITSEDFGDIAQLYDEAKNWQCIGQGVDADWSDLQNMYFSFSAAEATRYKRYFPNGTTFTFYLTKTAVTPPTPNKVTVTLVTSCNSGEVSFDQKTWGKNVSISVTPGTNIALMARSNNNTSSDGYAFIGFDGIWKNTWRENGNITTSGYWNYTVNSNITINATFEYTRWSTTYENM